MFNLQQAKRNEGFPVGHPLLHACLFSFHSVEALRAAENLQRVGLFCCLSGEKLYTFTHCKIQVASGSDFPVINLSLQL